MGRKCSHCGNIGHNSRTCSNFRPSNNNFVAATATSGPPIRLFGVHLDPSSSSSSNYSSSPNHNFAIKKSFSTDCLSLPSSSPPSSSSSFSSSRIHVDADDTKPPINGYLSDGLLTREQDRKKGEFFSFKFWFIPLPFCGFAIFLRVSWLLNKTHYFFLVFKLADYKNSCFWDELLWCFRGSMDWRGA